MIGGSNKKWSHVVNAASVPGVANLRRRVQRGTVSVPGVIDRRLGISEGYDLGAGGDRSKVIEYAKGYGLGAVCD